MPSLLRRIVIFAAVDGLILQSPGHGSRYNGNGDYTSIRIDYKTNRIASLSGPASDLSVRKDFASLETYGLVGKYCIHNITIGKKSFSDALP
jgi:hypothetical protein